jgi:RNA polymerase sigma-70 factor (ECF subfamily)
MAFGTTASPTGLDGAELRELMVRYQAADPSAVEAMVIRLSPALLRFLSSPNLSKDDTEDILQDFWLRLHRSRHTYRPGEPVLPWIFAIARHTSLDAYRRRRRLLAREITLPNIPEDLYQTQQPDVAEGEFLSVLDRLPKSQREVVLMLKVSGMSLEEVARATSVSVGAVKQRAHRAYAKLREILVSNRAIPSVSATGVEHEPPLRHQVSYIQHDTPRVSA